jgi:hypothetical protein
MTGVGVDVGSAVGINVAPTTVGPAVGGVGDDVGGIVATNEVVVVVLGVFVGKGLGADVGLVVSVCHKKVGV